MASIFIRSALAGAAIFGLASQTEAGSKPVACYEEISNPAVYATVTERVVVKPASSYEVVHPAVYGTRTRLVEIEPKRVVEQVSPAVVKTVHRKVKVKPSGTAWEWRKIDGRKVLCEVERPAVWTTVAETVVVRKERIKHVVVPARYERVTETVVIKPERVSTVTTPAEYANVSRRVLVSEGGTSWRKVKIKGHCG